MFKLGLKKLLTATLVAGSVFAVGATQTHASNYADTDFYFYFGGTVYSYHTDRTFWRQKQDSTPTYKKITQWSNSGESYTGWVMQYPNVQCSQGYYFDESYVNEERFLVNTVGSYNDACILVEMWGNWTPAVIEGVWSPDSI